ncbi:MAG TPA: NAD(P)/FAD-dependent oxidoreductase [Egicoccus sp.]|nr:NAD(P)/FAD-dependent oxidoreductase [Egicoccus sp.]HSK22947.1 NAD(P)/FAD-dependent oxidoreductase [Egicoccus sp.]
MTNTADVVVAGSGHNALITAVYLARSGRKVVVLETRERPGGGAVSEELVRPGFMMDTCSTGHTLIQNNPVIADDELGLLREFGLRYIDPDPVAHVAFPDGEQFTMWLDPERTVDEFARFSARDADTYRRVLAEWAEMGPVFGAANRHPIGFGPSLDERLREHPRGGVWRRRIALSAWEVIQHEYTEPHVRAFVFWQAFMTLVSMDLPGSGMLPYSIMAGRQKRSWCIPEGGSGRLTDALVAALEAAGGEVVCDQEVVELVVEDGRCTGVVTATGERFTARDAVVSSVHVKHLLDMAPREAWDDAFVYGVETFDPGLPMFAVQFATSEAPRFRGDPGTPTAVSSGLAGWPQDVIDVTREIRDGRPSTRFPWILVATPTLADPSRAPEGHHTVKFLVPCSPTPPGGHATWDDAKDEHAAALLAAVRDFAPNLTDDVILDHLVLSPLDIERGNAHMVGGSAHGGDRGVPYSGPLRPAPGWAQHRMPIPGLYQTGGTTHPGGSITGTPGRNAAQVLLTDLGTSIEEVLAKG